MWSDILKSQVIPLTDITVENENTTSVKNSGSFIYVIVADKVLYNSKPIWRIKTSEHV